MGQADDARFGCAACGKSYRWKPELSGRKVKCTCGHVMIAPSEIRPAGEEELIPLAGEPVSAQTVHGSQILAATGTGMPAITSVPAVDKPTKSKPSPQPKGASKNGRCPSCNSRMESGAVVCVSCGMNLQTGQKMATKAAGEPTAAPKQSIRVPSLTAKAAAHRTPVDNRGFLARFFGKLFGKKS